MNRKTEYALKRPFSPSQLKWRKGPGGKELVYITARDVMDRLDQVVGISGWTTSLHEVQGRVTCELSINIDGKWITKTDGAGDTSIEGEKGAISDALKGVLYYLVSVGYITIHRHSTAEHRPNGRHQRAMTKLWPNERIKKSKNFGGN